MLISWILLTSVDIETNPGPPRRWKYPCTVCSAPVKSNQRGIQCDRCDLWTHASCGGVGQEEYEGLYGEWYCPTCVRAELPFADVSRLSAVDTSITGSDLEKVTVSTSDSLFYANDGSMVVSHLNIRSVVNKVDDLRVLLERRSRALILVLVRPGWTSQ